MLGVAVGQDVQHVNPDQGDRRQIMCPGQAQVALIKTLSVATHPTGQRQLLLCVSVLLAGVYRRYSCRSLSEAFREAERVIQVATREKLDVTMGTQLSINGDRPRQALADRSCRGSWLTRRFFSRLQAKTSSATTRRYRLWPRPIQARCAMPPACVPGTRALATRQGPGPATPQ